MNVRFWGTRGSLPTPGADTLRYGGNTSCVQVTGEQGTVLVLDAGTGIRELGRSLPPGLRRVDVLMSHLHMDHIQGLGFFSALYNPDMEVHLWGPASITHDLKTRLKRYLSPPFFPVHLRDLPCKLVIHDGSHIDEEIGEFRVSSLMICHPGPTVGFRISNSKGTMAYMPDHEPILGSPKFLPQREWISGMATAQGVDLLIHDAQYSSNEYLTRIGWGHSSIAQAIEFASIAEVGKLAAFHHDPTHRDNDLDRMFQEVIADTSPRFSVIPAMEGELMTVAGH
ncbi:MAG: MBL fold metallo-hydrolase [Verrucomicrobiaceae bacterium]